MCLLMCNTPDAESRYDPPRRFPGSRESLDQILCDGVGTPFASTLSVAGRGSSMTAMLASADEKPCDVPCSRGAISTHGVPVNAMRRVSTQSPRCPACVLASPVTPGGLPFEFTALNCA